MYDLLATRSSYRLPYLVSLFLHWSHSFYVYISLHLSCLWAVSSRLPGAVGGGAFTPKAFRIPSSIYLARHLMKYQILLIVLVAGTSLVHTQNESDNDVNQNIGFDDNGPPSEDQTSDERKEAEDKIDKEKLEDKASEVTNDESKPTTISTGSLESTVETSEEEQTKSCSDRHDLCKFWSSIGECDSNKDWMSDHCPVSCDVCNGTMACIDRHRLCNFWAAIKECETNAVWMLSNCARSCKACKVFIRLPIIDMTQGTLSRCSDRVRCACSLAEPFLLIHPIVSSHQLSQYITTQENRSLVFRISLTEEKSNN
uniref:ShKT domain-containing protein n=1 Tax=Heterorhabditis bacteriophora TaxID=37862 RepID=A0A1I7WJR9_HETBA